MTPSGQFSGDLGDEEEQKDGSTLNDCDFNISPARVPQGPFDQAADCQDYENDDARD